MTQKDAWWWALLGVLIAAIAAFRFVPRYDYQVVPTPGAVNIVVYDKWTGRMQRAVYNDTGNLNVMGVYTPF
jgi:hypothetical protein